MRSRYRILWPVGLGTLLATIDTSIVNLALPALAQHFRVGLLDIRWISLSYLIVLVGSLLPVGRVADSLGRKKLFIIGFLILAISSALCGLSRTFYQLVAFRAAQGFGGAILSALGPALVTQDTPGNVLGKKLGFLGTIVGIGLVSGPLLGGVLLAWYGWESIFFVSIPISLLGLTVSIFLIPSDDSQSISLRKALDFPGTMMQFAIVALVICLIAPGVAARPHWGLTESSRLWLAPLLLATVCGFIFYQKKCLVPILSAELFRIKLFRNAIAAGFFQFAGFAAVPLLLPFFCEELLRLSPRATGASLAIIPSILLLLSPLSGGLADKVGSRALCSVGSLLTAIGIALLSWEGAFFPKIIVIGVGLALFQSPNNRAIMAEVPPSHFGNAASLLAVTRNLGFIVGTGLASESAHQVIAATGDLGGALRYAFKIAALPVFGAVFFSLARRERI